MAKSETTLQELKEFPQNLMKSFASIFAAITHHSESFSEFFDGEMSDSLLESDVMGAFDSLKNVLDNADSVISVFSSQIERFKNFIERERNKLSLSKPMNASPPKQCLPSPDRNTGRQNRRRSKIHDASLVKFERETPVRGRKGISRRKTTSQIDTNEAMEEEPSTSKEDICKLDTTFQFDATDVMEKETSLNTGIRGKRRSQIPESLQAKVRRETPVKSVKDPRRRKTISQFSMLEEMKEEILTMPNEDDQDERFTAWQLLFPLPNDVPETTGVYEIKVPSAKRPCFVGHCANLKVALSDHIHAKKIMFKQLNTFVSRNLSKLEFHYQITSSSSSAKEIADARLDSIEQSTGGIPFYNKLI